MKHGMLTQKVLDTMVSEDFERVTGSRSLFRPLPKGTDAQPSSLEGESFSAVDKTNIRAALNASRVRRPSLDDIDGLDVAVPASKIQKKPIKMVAFSL